MSTVANTILTNSEKTMGLIRGLSWSWKRAVGLSGLKNKIARKIGIPLTQSGFEKKIGHVVIRTVFSAFK